MGNTSTPTALIIGAGPAGLTAAFELLKRTSVKPVIYELSDALGGISRTVNYKGNRIDIGGHRFFSKSDRVMNWWKEILPLQSAPTKDDLVVNLAYQNKKQHLKVDKEGVDANETDRVFLIRKRFSRIFVFRKLFQYPISLSAKTLSNFGFVRSVRIITSYILAQIFPIRPEVTLRDFIINRFGKELYFTFFRSYTQKVWGVPCRRISAEWGAQRIKGVSLRKALMSNLQKIFRKSNDIRQKSLETSLIEMFLYPKYGPGQVWEEVARSVREQGGEIHMKHQVQGIHFEGNRVRDVEIKDLATGEMRRCSADYVFSTMPVQELIQALGSSVPEGVKEVAQNLVYRDFVTVGILLKKITLENERGQISNELPPDNWIYIQEKDLKVGRIQIFNNWSPYMVKDPNTVWLGLEYFCNEGDSLWSLDDAAFKALGVRELEKMGMADPMDVLDGTVIRMKKTYPAYFGSYDRFDEIRAFTDKFENLFLVGRNGMHRYNNQDHSMLTAMVSVDNIEKGIVDKDNIWSVNTEQEYHEEKNAS